MIYLFSVGATKIKSSAAVLLLPVCILISGWSAELLISITALVMHEIAHTLMINALGYEIESIELQPFGFIARLSSPYYNSLDELLIASTGPAASMVLGLITLSITSRNALKYAELFGYISVTLGLMNLIPAYPLDGGKMLLSILDIILGAKRAKRLATYIGIAIALIFSGATVYLLFIDLRAIPYAAMFILLLIAAIKERKELDMAAAHKLVIKQRLFRHGNALNVRQIVINENSSVFQASRQLDGGKFTIFTVLDDDMNVVRTITETELMRLSPDKQTLKFHS